MKSLLSFQANLLLKFTDEIFETLTWNNKTRFKKPRYQGKNGSREYSKGNKTVPEKVATTHTEDGHKQDT